MNPSGESQIRAIMARTRHTGLEEDTVPAAGRACGGGGGVAGAGAVAVCCRV